MTSSGPDTKPLNDNELVPEIAAQLVRNTPGENSGAAAETPKPDATGATGTEPAYAGAGPLHYLADISDLRPGQEEALPKLRDRLNDIFPNAE